MTTPIQSFCGPHRYLSNFWPCHIEFDGLTYPSVEHAYVAAKTCDPAIRREVASLGTAGEAKRFGRGFPIRDDWDSVKLEFMYSFLKQKFSPNTYLAAMLKDTRDALLEEGNTWGDTFWGVCKGRGENNLGKLLMRVREELKQENDFWGTKP